MFLSFSKSVAGSWLTVASSWRRFVLIPFSLLAGIKVDTMDDVDGAIVE